MIKPTCTTATCAGRSRTKTPGLCGACYCWKLHHPQSSPIERPGLQPPRTCKESGCDGRVTGYGWCQKHYTRQRVHGSPTVTLRRANGSLLAIIAAAVRSETDECVILGGHKGRPRITFQGRQMNASRVAWTVAYGDPGNLHVLHLCNGGSGANGCINPRHLYLDTNTRNRQDMVAANRSHHGETHHNAILTEDAVRQIRDQHAALGMSYAALGRQFGVTESQIRRVVRRRNWVRVED